MPSEVIAAIGAALVSGWAAGMTLAYVAGARHGLTNMLDVAGD